MALVSNIATYFFLGRQWFSHGLQAFPLPFPTPLEGCMQNKIPGRSEQFSAKQRFIDFNNATESGSERNYKILTNTMEISSSLIESMVNDI